MIINPTLVPSTARPIFLRSMRMIALVLGLILAFSALPYPWSFLTPLPLAGIFFLITNSATPRSAFWLGFLAGLGFFSVHLSWLPISFGSFYGPSVLLPMLFLPLVLGVFWGLTAYLSRCFGRYTLAALPFAWVLMEFLRSQGIFGFPWGTLGYAFLPTPLIQVADLGGIYLLSLLVCVIAASVAALTETRLPFYCVSVILIIATLYGVTRTNDVLPDKAVLLVQGAVNPLEKATQRSLSELDLYQNLSLEGLNRSTQFINLVIWPEGASPLPASQPEVIQVLEKMGSASLIGAPQLNPYQNSVYGFKDDFTGLYSKRILVPFGENFPLRQALSFVYDPLFDFIGLPGLIGVTAGKEFSPIRLGDIIAGTYICYESVFPQAARAMTLAGANLLVNVSNDAWFGRTQGAEQHFQMGRVRAIETRRYLARAGNDGITAVINPLGQVEARFPRGERFAFEAMVGLSEYRSFYVQFGDWVILFSALTLIILLIVSLIKRNHYA